MKVTAKWRQRLQTSVLANTDPAERAV